MVTSLNLSRRQCLTGAFAAAAMLAGSRGARAQSSTPFAQWVATFRQRALARGISAQTYDQVMGAMKPDTQVFDLIRNQPEFSEQIWQYLNRRVSDWRISTGKEKAQEYAALFTRIEQDIGVDRGVLLALWGVESAFGDPLVLQNHIRPVLPA